MAETTEITALIVIDIGKSVLEGKVRATTEIDPVLGEKLRHRLHEIVLPNLIRLVDYFHATHQPVVYVNWESYRTLYPELSPRGDDVLVKKKSRGAFPTSDLDEQLRKLGVKTCVFAGADSAVCVSSTVRGAIDRGYKTMLVEDASISSDPWMHDAAVRVLAYNGATTVTTRLLLGESDQEPVKPAGYARNLRLSHSFDHDAEMWQVYDYDACIPAGHDVYRAAHWEQRGGVNDSGYIWADDSQWTIDTPENPHSVLALMTWRQWYLRGPADLRNATLSVYLRGDALDLRGGRCLFWVMSRKLATRWHLATHPLSISNGTWAKEPSRVTLATDSSQWHRSWTVPGQQQASVDEVLAGVESYGFSFVGFDGKPTGRFAVDEFDLKAAT